MTLSSKYVPFDQYPKLGKMEWCACWCAFCCNFFMVTMMQERLACPYCFAQIEPSTLLFQEGDPDGPQDRYSRTR